MCSRSVTPFFVCQMWHAAAGPRLFSSSLCDTRSSQTAGVDAQEKSPQRYGARGGHARCVGQSSIELRQLKSLQRTGVSGSQLESNGLAGHDSTSPASRAVRQEPSQHFIIVDLEHPGIDPHIDSAAAQPPPPGQRICPLGHSVVPAPASVPQSRTDHAHVLSSQRTSPNGHVMDGEHCVELRAQLPSAQR